MPSATTFNESPNLPSTLIRLIDRLDQEDLCGSGVIPWSCPVMSFGNPMNSTVATVGINPSNREFVDDTGVELQGSDRRFHTLASLGLDSWLGADARHLELILDTFSTYFTGNPYNAWFGKLEFLLNGIGVSYYSSSNAACHFDLVPYATTQKWSELSLQQHSALLKVAGDTLGLIVRDSAVDLLILNGTSVVKRLEGLSGLQLSSEIKCSWSLPRRSTRDVRGVAFSGKVDTLAGVHLGREVKVLGFNHNLQGSFGVTTAVVDEIKDWLFQTMEQEEW